MDRIVFKNELLPRKIALSLLYSAAIINFVFVEPAIAQSTPKSLSQSALYQRLQEVTKLFKFFSEKEKQDYIDAELAANMQLGFSSQGEKKGEIFFQEIYQALLLRVGLPEYQKQQIQAWTNDLLFNVNGSNEDVKTFKPTLEKLSSGGSLIALGHEQVLDLIAFSRPESVYIYDIDPRVILQHMLFEAALLNSTTAEQFKQFFLIHNHASSRQMILQTYGDENIVTFFDFVADRLEKLSQSCSFTTSREMYKSVRAPYLARKVSMRVADNASKVLSQIGEDIRSKKSYAKVVYWSNSLEKRWTPVLTPDFLKGVNELPGKPNSVVLTTWAQAEKADAIRLGITTQSRVSTASLFDYHVDSLAHIVKSLGCQKALSSDN